MGIDSCKADVLDKRSPEFQRRTAMLLLTEALAAFSLSLDNSISIFAWIFSQSTSTWQRRKDEMNKIRQDTVSCFDQ